MRIVVAPDKFKGTLTSSEVARAIVEGLQGAIPEADATVRAMSDGGEGSLFAVVAGVGGDVQPVRAHDPLGRAVTAPLAYLADGRVFVEAASTSGLAVMDVPDAVNASSRGTGDLILQAAQGGGPAPRIVVGVGGMASTDGGTGAAAAVGWRFLDSAGNDLRPGGAALADMAAIDSTAVDDRVKRCSIVAACDVRNRLTGPRGAARAFAPQKGASPHEVELLEVGIERLVRVIRQDLDIDVGGIPHGGAGGGLGAGLAAFFGAELTSGFDLIADAVGLRAAIEGADLVVTGEGRIDQSTLEGKVVSGVARLANESSVDCVVIAGEIDSSLGSLEEALGVTHAFSLVERFGRSRALVEPAHCIANVVAALLRS